MTIQEAKQQFIDFLYSRPVYKRPVTRDLYLTRCPYCGDSRSSYNTGHLYIRIEPDSDSKMVYYCQRCEEHGRVGQELIELLEGGSELQEGIALINKNGVSRSRAETIREFMYFEAMIPDRIADNYRKKIAYIEKRMEFIITPEMIQSLKIIVSPYDFLILNKIKKLSFKRRAMSILERDYVGFLSTGNSHILFRDITNTHEHPWIKYPIYPESSRNMVSYSYAKDVDVMSTDPFIINIAEGVLDIIGVSEYYYKDFDNTLNIAAGGRNYMAILTYLIHIGLFGDNITLNVYMDNDKQFNTKGGKDIGIPNYFYDKMSPLFGEMNVYHNLIGKDYGVPRDKIILDKKRI